MSPTLSDGQRILAFKRSPKPNDIIVINYKGKVCGQSSGILIKRLIKIENDNYWIEGDNKDHSCDSRSFGWVSPDQRIYFGVVK